MIAFARRANWGADNADVGAREHCVERRGELAVPVADQEPKLLGAVAEVHQQLAGLLGDPGPRWDGAVIPAIRMRRRPCSITTRM
jgi:hypothetical protein